MSLGTENAELCDTTFAYEASALRACVCVYVYDSHSSL